MAFLSVPTALPLWAKCQEGCGPLFAPGLLQKGPSLGRHLTKLCPLMTRPYSSLVGSLFQKPEEVDLLMSKSSVFASRSACILSFADLEKKQHGEPWGHEARRVGPVHAGCPLMVLWTGPGG